MLRVRLDKAFLGIFFLAMISACGDQVREPVGMPTPTEARVSPVLTQEARPTALNDEVLPDEGQLLLSEVLFAPMAGASGFIELMNAGRAGLELSGVWLENERGESLELPADTPSLLPGEIYFISTDTSIESQAGAYDADLSSFLSIENGTLFLFGPDGVLADRIDWGVENPNSVPLGQGGVPPVVFPRGTSIGRPPLSYAIDPLAWTTYSDGQVTPGAPNPVPAVEILIPSDRAIFEDPEIPLNWYGIPGANGYRVQVAMDETFAAPLIDAIVSAPPVTTDRLVAGTYYWRVQLISMNETTASYSPVHSFTIDPSKTSGITLNISFSSPRGGVPQLRQKILSVPLFYQKKDSNMLLLESPQTGGAHTWNDVHAGYSGDDPADNANCALASTAMLNHYFGGDLTQDIIGFFLRKDERPGPERDLNWGRGLYIDDIEQVLNFAVPGSILYFIPENNDYDTTVFSPLSTPASEFFDRVVELIDAEQPVLAVYPGHATLIVGYRVEGQTRSYYLNDPSIGRYWVNATSNEWAAYFVPGSEGMEDDPTNYQDYDDDGVNNLDETIRFHTDPHNPDTDEDGLDDGIDIFASAHDSIYGYSDGENMSGRDFDSDHVAMELDPDSDEGGCLDGFEDSNKDGLYDSSENETWNFDGEDDRCWKLGMEWIFNDEWGETLIEFTGNFKVDDELEIEGKGYYKMDHVGPCVRVSGTTPFTIGGRLVEESFELKIEDLPDDQGLEVSDDLLDGCTLGDTIGEGYAVGSGSGWGMPEIIEIKAEHGAMTALGTYTVFSARFGDLIVLVERIQPESKN
jgi:hypothetical protein